MKIPALEARIRSARAFHRNTTAHFDHGIRSWHDYSRVPADELTYWDYAVFIVNDYRIALSWDHPRFKYGQMVHAEALRQTEHLSPFKESYLPPAQGKASGRRSERRSAGVMEVLPEVRQAYLDQLDAAFLRIGEEQAFSVHPSLAWGRSWKYRIMRICAPFEVRSEEALRELVARARRLARRESTLLKEFGGQVYSQQDWLRERPIMKLQRERRRNARSSLFEGDAISIAAK